jgi:hypothetical protein
MLGMKKKVSEKIKEVPFLYKAGVFLVLLLPLLSFPPIFHPAAFAKGAIFKIIFVAILVFFIYDIFFSKDDSVFKKFVGKIKAQRGFFFFVPLVLLAWLFVAVIFSVDSNFSFFGDPRRGGGFLNFSLLTAFGYFLYLILDKKSWSLAWNILFFTGVGATIFAILQWQGVGEVITEANRRPSAMFGNPTVLGTYLAVLVFPLLSFLLQEEKRFKKYIYEASFVIIIFGIILTFTRAALLGVGMGLIYFVLFYPKKENIIRNIKIAFIGLIAVTFFGVYYVNTAPMPQFVEENSFLSGFSSRLDIEKALQDPRIGGFIIGWEAVKEKPLLGYGPENFNYAFNKHYHPDIPYLERGLWWDKAHNLPIELGIWGGFPALAILLFLFASLFWALKKKEDKEKKKSIQKHAIKATLITFFVANFFTVDDFTTYLLLFTIFGYVGFLCSKEEEFDFKQILEKRKKFWKYRNIFLVLIIPFLIYFVYFNFSMLNANKYINKAEIFFKPEKCEVIEEWVEKATEKDNPISFYLLFKKAIIKDNCRESIEAEEEIFYILKEATEKNSTHTRSYTNLGTLASALMENEEGEKKDYFLDASIDAFCSAKELSPNRHLSYGHLAVLYLYKEDFNKSLESAEKCLSIINSYPPEVELMKKEYRPFQKEEQGMCLFLKRFSSFLLEKEIYFNEVEVDKEKAFDPEKLLRIVLDYHVEKNNTETVNRINEFSNTIWQKNKEDLQHNNDKKNI